MAKKKIVVIESADKNEFNYHCHHCKMWRPLRWYEPPEETARVMRAMLSGGDVEKPSDGQRFFAGAFCSTECLEEAGYTLKGEVNEKKKEKDPDTGGTSETKSDSDEGSGGEGDTGE